MNSLCMEDVRAYRSGTFRKDPKNSVKTKEEAVSFVNQRGFIFFWPISGFTMPSLWTAVAGDRPVADAHDDPGHITWSWKDSLLGQHTWYYAKVLRKKATIISLDVVRFFYALSENYGSYEDDYLTLYEQGRMTVEAKAVYVALLKEGVMDTVELRRATHMTSRDSDYRFNRSLIELQTDFKIVPVGVTRSGAWNYAFAYDIVARHYPEIPDQAHNIREREARRNLIELYLQSVGAVPYKDLGKLFGWRPRDIEQPVTELIQLGVLSRALQMDHQSDEWVALQNLISAS